MLFDDKYELLHDWIGLKAVAPIADIRLPIRNTLYGGSTALLDAIGHTINKIKRVQEHTAEEYRADKVLFVIITRDKVKF